MWTLVIYIYAGMLAKGDSVALTSVPGFTSKPACIAAADETKGFVSGSTKKIEHACVYMGK